MRRRHHQITVGLFVFGAIVLVIAGSALFYHLALEAKQQTFVMFFKGSLKGLEATAPVTYRGVKIGEVSAVEITENIDRHKVEIPVYVRFFVRKKLGFTQDPIHLLIRSGFVADIAKPNFLTGLSEIELVKTPPPRPQFRQTYYGHFPVFPTRNTIDKYTTLDQALNAARETLDSIRKLIESSEVRSTIMAARSMANSVGGLAEDLESSVPNVVRSINQTLESISGAAYSTQNLTDYLSRNPESLLRGKK